MATTAEVQKLAALARITVSEEGLEKFTKEFDAILAYVSQLEKLDLPTFNCSRLRVLIECFCLTIEV